MRVRRHLPEGHVWRWRPKLPHVHLHLPSVRGNRRILAIGAGIFGVTALAGYLVAALVLFPAPMFAASHSVPRVLGMTRDAAHALLRKDKFRIASADQRPDPVVPAGSVLWQDPPPGVVASEGTEVTLTLSSGPPRIPVPDVAGYTDSLARSLIQAAGLVVNPVERAQAPVPKDVAVSTRPPAGTALRPDSKVTLVVSVGAPTITVPTLVGKTLDDTKAILDSAGLTLGTSLAHTVTTAPPGTVIDQQPAAGTLAAPGTAINVIVARGESP
ncbi:MAG TPA: PASTA domain-containing protein [Gemmatimonadales bacterium]|nr:PASTA domain-containing protein [Gemmatimonadales bacterium]